MLLQIFQRLIALVSLAVLVAGGYLLWSWWDIHQALEAGRAFGPDPEWRLWLGGALLALSFLGRIPWIWLLSRGGEDAQRLRRSPGAAVRTPNGAVLHVEEHGPADAPALVFVHGWGMDGSVWWDARRALANRFRIIIFDLAGLGRSKGPPDGRYSLDRFAEDLGAVLDQAAPRQAILVGHSIGGMILQTFARQRPDALGGQVMALVLENTSHTDPSGTTILGRPLQAMKPVLELLMRLDVVLFPLVWLMNWQSYLSGSTHVAMRVGGFGTRPTRAQLEQVARLATRNSPAVQAKGNLAMMHWDATPDLRRLRIPTLVFIGGRDLVTVAQAGETIVAEAPQARPERQARAGHMGPLELSDAYNEAIADFADQIFTRGAAWADRATDEDAKRPRTPTLGDLNGRGAPPPSARGRV
jgi:pimeloyl-ACP methyl ester carboxylesterase